MFTRNTLITMLALTSLTIVYPLMALSGPILQQIAQGLSATRQQEIVDKVADKMIDKISNASCSDLHTAMKGSDSTSQGEIKDEIRERFVNLLKQNADLKAYFFQKVSTPLMTKMFDCGMIPPQEKSS